MVILLQIKINQIMITNLMRLFHSATETQNHRIMCIFNGKSPCD